MPLVVLAVLAPGVDAADGQQVPRLRIGADVARERLAPEHVEPDPADARGGAGEVLLDHLGRQSHGLEDLGAVVGLDRRDAHLGERLEQSLADRTDDVALGLLERGGVRGRVAVVLRRRPHDLLERLEHEVRVDGRGAVADQRREVVDLARLAGLHDEAGLQAGALAHEMVMHGGDGQQRRDGGARRPHAAVGQDQDVGAVGDRLRRLPADALDGPRDPVRALRDRPGDRDRVRAEDRRVHAAQRLELAVAQDRMRDDELVRVLGAFGEQVGLRPDRRADRHDDGLADRVDGRVGDLGEELLEVREQRRRLVGEHRQREVVAHRADRLLALGGHRREQDPQVLLRVAERELARAQGLARRLPLALRQVLEPHDALAVPVAVGTAGRDVLLDLLVLDDAAELEVDHEQLARLQPPLAQDV
jgi:hypothetical protein